MIMYIPTNIIVVSCFGSCLFRVRLQHGLGGVRQFLRHEVSDHVGPFPHVFSGLVVIVRAVDLQLKPLGINVPANVSVRSLTARKYVQSGARENGERTVRTTITLQDGFKWTLFIFVDISTGRACRWLSHIIANAHELENVKF